MKFIWLAVGFFGVLMISVAFLPMFFHDLGRDPVSEELYFGVSFGGKTAEEAKLLIDRVKSYTNLFIVNSWDISGGANATTLTEVCDYAVENGLNVLVYFNFIYYNYTRTIGTIYNASSWELYGIDPWHMDWLNSSRQRWGDKFLGVYLYDEPGGKQIDGKHWFDGKEISTLTGRRMTTFDNATGYSDAAYRYVNRSSGSISRSGSMQRLTNASLNGSIVPRMPVFTSDYALYWFDYLAGYDAVFAQFGWNYSRVQHMALCRGAASVQNKNWGVIITWTYNEPPYLESAEEMLQDFTAAYKAGAKYIIVFNFPKIEGNPYGILTEDHFGAMEKFWNQVYANPSGFGEVRADVAFVLPKDYGWGMRNPDDRIWGLWNSDDLSPLIWDKMIRLLERYGSRLDIVYGDSRFDFSSKYSKIHYWNSTVN